MPHRSRVLETRVPKRKTKSLRLDFVLENRKEETQQMKKPNVQICRRRTNKKKGKKNTRKKPSNWTRRRTLGMNAKKNTIGGYEREEEEECWVL